MNSAIKDFNISIFGFITLNRVNNALILLERYDTYSNKADPIYRSVILKDFEYLLDLRCKLLKKKFKILNVKELS